ncbi:PoNe immunity protein domain-containing protein [Collinsella vaginalis]|uniref:PoNe immunity protein domain-containing protein n=1 Tax=Collinsella vaginalis TaxID=1870987 RepID=UPI000A271BF8|nr:PoNe immunity protein domain-containing protein [Collinsella vaginalis]
MRDRRASKEYFDRYIREHEERIARYEARIAELEQGGEIWEGLRWGVRTDRLGIIRVRYSRGDDLVKLRPAAVEAVSAFIGHLGGMDYGDYAEVVSLAALFGAGADIANAMAREMSAAGALDRLTGTILASAGSTVAPPLGRVEWQYFNPELFEALEAGPGPQAIGLVKRYVARWPRMNVYAGWTGSHGDLEHTVYTGYWCFEAAALVRGMGLADAFRSIRSTNFPADLACFQPLG